MPLTAYCLSQEKELDVQQLLKIFSERDGIPIPATVKQIPNAWRVHIWQNVECPSCFVTGADIVNEGISRTSGNGPSTRDNC